jgi:hypothetical protein
MKRTLFILTLIIAFVFQGNAQNLNSDSIKVQKVFGGCNFILNSKKLTVKQLVLTMKPHEQAYLEMKSSQKYYTAGIITASVGGFLLGWQMGNAINANSPKWGMVALSSGIALLSIPLTRQSVRKARNAVDLYNSSLSQTTFWKKNKPELRLCFDGNNIALKIKLR